MFFLEHNATMGETPAQPQPQSVDREELRQYVEAFARSSDRSRYAFYTVIVATVLILIANWNVQPWNWPRLRIRTWFPDSTVTTSPTGKNKAAPLTAADTFFNIQREEYARQFTSRAVFTTSPIPGVSIDVNDIGIIGGLALILLMLVLALCMDREHENLYLAFFKVRRLVAAERAEADTSTERRGESASNLLYHALAVTQVLTSPPTLARWKNRGILHRFRFIFLAPAGVYLWVVLSNRDTKAVAEHYHADVTKLMAAQFVMAAILLLLSGYTWINSRAMDKRWNRMFFHVNPGRRYFRQMGWWQWLKLWPLWEKEKRWYESVQKQLVDGITKGPSLMTGKTGEIPATEEVRTDCVKRPVVERVAKKLERDGISAAKNWCLAEGHVFSELIAFRPSKNEIVEREIELPNPQNRKKKTEVVKTWTVSGIWEFLYEESPKPLAAATPSPVTATPASVDRTVTSPVQNDGSAE